MARRLAANNRDSAALMRLDLLLAILLASWILGPLFSRGVDPNGPGLSPGRMRHFPLSLRHLHTIGLGGALVQPVYWILVLASALALVPLASAGQAVAGLAAGLLYLAFCLLAPGVVWLGVAAFLTLGSPWIVAGSVLGLGSAAFLAFHLRWLLHADTAGLTAFLSGVLARLPGHAATGAASGSTGAGSIVVLGALVAGSLGATLGLLRRVLNHRGRASSPGRRPRGLMAWPDLWAWSRGWSRARATRGGVRPDLSALLSKEMAYVFRTLDFWLGLSIGVGAGAYVALASHPPMWVVAAGLIAVGLNEVAFALNSFGLDGGAIDRYRLLPLSGKDILSAKNAAFFVTSLAGLLPVIAAGAVRFGLPLGAAALAGSLGSLFLVALWGNVLSVHRPARRSFFSMESSDQSGGLIGAAVALLIWILPLLLTLLVFRFGVVAIVAANVAFALCGRAVHRRLAGWSGVLFERRAHEMREILNS